MSHQDTAPLPTIVADDHRPLLEAVRQLFLRTEEGPTAVVGSVGEAIELLQQAGRAWRRVVSDYGFDHETLTGVDLLEEARSRLPDAELILLTGRPSVDAKDVLRVKRANIRVVRKGSVSSEFIRDLVRGVANVHYPVDTDNDVAEMILRHEALVTRLQATESLNDVLIEDIVSSLQAMPRQDERVAVLEGRPYSPSQLRREVTSRSEIGLRIVRLHHRLFRIMRGEA